MPIKRCALPGGGQGYRWGDHGTCYAERSKAAEQAQAAYANGYTGDESLEQAIADEAMKCTTCDGSGKKDGATCPTCKGTGYMASDSATRIDMCDAFVLDGAVRKTKMGFLAADAKVARTGIQIYSGKEVGRPDMKEVRVYRSADEVFKKDSLETYAHKPITLTHPREMVDSRNWGKYARGYTDGSVARDGECVRVPLLMTDQALIDAVEKHGIKQLSMGYTCELKWGEGKTPEGLTYDAAQTDISINHLAVVPLARGGDHLRVGDELDEGVTKMPKRIIIDGVPVDVVDEQGAAIIERQTAKDAATIKELNEKIAKLTTDAATAATAHGAAVAAEVAKVQAKDGEIVVLRKAVEDAKVTPEKLLELVKTRSAIVDKAKTILPKDYVYDAKSDDDIRKDVVVTKLGDAAKSLTTPEAINGAFAAIAGGVATSGTKPLADALSSSRPHQVTSDAVADRSKAFTELGNDLENAWKPKQAAAA